MTSVSYSGYSPPSGDPFWDSCSCSSSTAGPSGCESDISSWEGSTSSWEGSTPTDGHRARNIYTGRGNGGLQFHLDLSSSWPSQSHTSSDISDASQKTPRKVQRAIELIGSDGFNPRYSLPRRDVKVLHQATHSLRGISDTPTHMALYYTINTIVQELRPKLFGRTPEDGGPVVYSARGHECAFEGTQFSPMSRFYRELHSLAEGVVHSPIGVDPSEQVPPIINIRHIVKPDDKGGLHFLPVGSKERAMIELKDVRKNCSTGVWCGHYRSKSPSELIQALCLEGELSSMGTIKPRLELEPLDLANQKNFADVPKKKDRFKFSTFFPEQITKEGDLVRLLLKRKVVARHKNCFLASVKPGNGPQFYIEGYMRAGGSKMQSVFPVFSYNEFREGTTFEPVKGHTFTSEEILELAKTALEVCDPDDSQNHPIRYSLSDSEVIDLAPCLPTKYEVSKGILFAIPRMLLTRGPK